MTGPGGVYLPRAAELGQLLDHGTEDSVSTMCFTWNIAGKANRSLSRLNSLFAKMAPRERPSLIALALQELPPSTLFSFYQFFYEFPTDFFSVNSILPSSNPLANHWTQPIASSVGSGNGPKCLLFSSAIGFPSSHPVGFSFASLQLE